MLGKYLQIKSLFSKAEKIQGYIGHFELENWWCSHFTKEERNYMVEVFQPMGSTKNILAEGTIGQSVTKNRNDTPLVFLYTLASWFDNPKGRGLAYKIIAKAEEFTDGNQDVLSLHFFYASKMKLFYKIRETEGNALKVATDFCQKQIGIAEQARKIFLSEWGSPLPTHEGYSQLCVILEKQGKFDEVVKIAQKAKNQGWNGDWDKRIERCSKKLKA